jgi:hypothetical protein
LIALLAAAIADLCGPAPTPVAPPDPADAARYVQVGDEARAAGDIRVAAVAYRDALARDPGNVAARDALAELCKSELPADDSDALLAAIARYRKGELEAARVAFAAIAAHPGASESGAHLFLGLIALADHQGGTAVRELELARRDPAYDAAARAVLPLAHRDGVFAVVLLAEPEVDTNPQLLPDTPPMGATTGPRKTDEDLLLAGTITARPARTVFIRDAVTWRGQRTLSGLDFFAESAQLGAEIGGADRLSLRGDFDYDLLDGKPYLIAGGLHAQARRELEGIAFVASYTVRRRDYQQVAESDFTGWTHAGDVGAIFHVTPRFDLDTRVAFGRELTDEAPFTNASIGFTATARARVGVGVRVAAFASGWYASYDGAEPDGELRRDGHGEAGGDVEIDLGDHVLATCGTNVVGNASTIDDFRYWKLVVRCGLAVAIGGP